tara:strand:- start:40 stop:318 length:279 start_codon:yes stop_codon:yes gene_type:complete
LARRVVKVVVLLLLLLEDDVNDDDDREVLLLLLKVIVKVVDSVFDSLSLYVVSRVVVFTVRSFFGCAPPPPPPLSFRDFFSSVCVVLYHLGF